MADASLCLKYSISYAASGLVPLHISCKDKEAVILGGTPA